MNSFRVGSFSKSLMGLILFSSLISLSAWANDDDMSAAVNDVSQKLKGGEAGRKSLIKDDAGKSIDSQVKALSGGDSAMTDEMYSVAADMLPTLMEKSKGDPAKLEALMKEAQAHPEKFYESMPENVKARVKAIVDKKEKSQKKP